MVDIVDKVTRSRMMAGIKGKDTGPEILLRKALYAKGFRYRLGGCGLPGKPDMVFPALKYVVFVHGCFWHIHDCAFFKWPSTNSIFWRQKLQNNKARDARVVEQLKILGWNIIIVWECELRKTKFCDPRIAIERVAVTLRGGAS